MGEYKHHTFLEQIELFESRGLCVEDKERAAKKLEFINYYKLKELAYPFAVYSEDKTYRYQEISFDLLIKRYYQDKKLRANILSCVEKIEVAFKTRLCHLLGERYGAYGYLNFDKWMNKEKYCKYYISEKQGDFKKKLKELVSNNKMRCVSEHFEKNPDMKKNAKIPIWMLVESLTFGEVLVWYEWMSKKNREKISNAFSATPTELESWLKVLKFIRNQCAHNANVIDLRLKTKPTLKEEWKDLIFIEENHQSLGGLADVLVIMCYLTIKINARYAFNDLQGAINRIVEKNRFKANLLGFKDVYSAENAIKILGGHFQNKNTIFRTRK
ncbi:MAG: Abi family protein [Peptostreptococcaceae bacterium]|nr:Abi family protein [Peptostreptococcaceae bacterium]